MTSERMEPIIKVLDSCRMFKEEPFLQGEDSSFLTRFSIISSGLLLFRPISNVLVPSITQTVVSILFGIGSSVASQPLLEGMNRAIERMGWKAIPALFLASLLIAGLVALIV